jgi:hypothetical protein
MYRAHPYRVTLLGLLLVALSILNTPAKADDPIISPSQPSPGCIGNDCQQCEKQCDTQCAGLSDLGEDSPRASCHKTCKEACYTDTPPGSAHVRARLHPGVPLPRTGTPGSGCRDRGVQQELRRRDELRQGLRVRRLRRGSQGSEEVPQELRGRVQV